MQYRVDNNLSNQNNSLRQVYSNLSDSSLGVLEVIKTLEGDIWEGNSKEAALDLLKILHTYHLKLMEASQLGWEALSELEEKASSYMGSGSIPTLWASDSPSKSFEEKFSERFNETSTYLYNNAAETKKYVENKAYETEKYFEKKASDTGDYLVKKAIEAKDCVKEKANEFGQSALNKAHEAEKGISDTYNYIASKL